MTHHKIDIDRLGADPDELRLTQLVAWARAEADALDMVIPAAVEAQWTAAPVARPRDDTTERAKNQRADPTSDVALDTARQALRQQVVESETSLRKTIIALRGVRLGLERSLTSWTE
ncbi:hypothetical protein Acy02nite_68690 [Actinoplanes cyaneus]|uniref:Uncharacterized protein n=1 Tax=Actinoplanes cyaneus TaxID=52696 RepID=A0A919IPA5_9ACTN|nr:hypothetical protein [Actinoplanes cyaneus]MCW2139082.1 hypothetical protein [Actinoplanes cyaneus]GID68988.1 hypothetical protein Acy02nite_68690 [Actinoplanes cyaneus]